MLVASFQRFYDCFSSFYCKSQKVFLPAVCEVTQAEYACLQLSSVVFSLRPDKILNKEFNADGNYII